MRVCLIGLCAGLLVWPAVAAAQGPAVPGHLAANLAWEHSASPMRGTALSTMAGKDRGTNAAIGGIIGLVAGLGVCTLISNLQNESTTGISTCTSKGYAIFGAGGLVLGAVIGRSL
ncbi:MAG: hypothetical protein AB7I33_06355 [Gemmatimonadales bacterium]